MSTRSRPATPAVALATAAAAGLTSAIGVLFRGDGSAATVTSVRGETYDIATAGVYAWNAQRVVAEGVGWDLFTLLVAVPAMVAAAALVARGSVRGRLAAAGLYGYFLYLYLEYAVTWAFGPLFLAFIGTFILAFVGLGLVAADIARDGVVDRFGPGYPTRAWPALLVAMSLVLVLLWSARIVQGLTAGVDGVLLGETTMTVQALDLALVVPISLAVATGVWRRRGLALAIGAAYAVTFTTMAAAIVSMLLSASIVNGEPELAPMIVFGFAAAGGLWLGARAFRAAGEEPASYRSGAPAPAPTPA